MKQKLMAQKRRFLYQFLRRLDSALYEEKYLAPALVYADRSDNVTRFTKYVKLVLCDKQRDACRYFACIVFIFPVVNYTCLFGCLRGQSMIQIEPDV